MIKNFPRVIPGDMVHHYWSPASQAEVVGTVDYSWSSTYRTLGGYMVDVGGYSGLMWRSDAVVMG